MLLINSNSALVIIVLLLMICLEEIKGTTRTNVRPCCGLSRNKEKLRGEAGSRSRRQDVDRIKRPLNKASVLPYFAIVRDIVL